MNSPNAAPAVRDGDHAGERQPAHHPDDRLGGGLLRCRRVCLAMADSRSIAHIATITASSAIQAPTETSMSTNWERSVAAMRFNGIGLSTVSSRRTVEGLAPAGGGRGAGQQAAVLTTDPEGYSPSTRTVCGANSGDRVGVGRAASSSDSSAGRVAIDVGGDPLGKRLARRPGARPTPCAPRAERPVAWA